MKTTKAITLDVANGERASKKINFSGWVNDWLDMDKKKEMLYTWTKELLELEQRLSDIWLKDMGDTHSMVEWVKYHMSEEQTRKTEQTDLLTMMTESGKTYDQLDTYEKFVYDGWEVSPLVSKDEVSITK